MDPGARGEGQRGVPGAEQRAAALLEAVVDAAEGELVMEIRERLADLYTDGGQLERARTTLSRMAEQAQAEAGVAPEAIGAALTARRSAPRRSRRRR